MIDLSPSSLRVLAIMVLGSIWFFLLIQQIEENNESNNLYNIFNNVVSSFGLGYSIHVKGDCFSVHRSW